MGIKMGKSEMGMTRMKLCRLDGDGEKSTGMGVGTGIIHRDGWGWGQVILWFHYIVCMYECRCPR